MTWRSMAGLAAAGAGLLLALACQAQNIDSVYLKFLHRHGVPCQAIRKLDITHYLDDVVTCDDGREWILFWLENEVAFIRPDSGQPYRWRSDVHRSTPWLYAAPNRTEPGFTTSDQMAIADD
jgi:hypothetical protein